MHHGQVSCDSIVMETVVISNVPILMEGNPLRESQGRFSFATLERPLVALGANRFEAFIALLPFEETTQVQPDLIVDNTFAWAPTSVLIQPWLMLTPGQDRELMCIVLLQ